MPAVEHIWEELQVLRAYLRTQRFRSALKIQRHYRGWKGRRAAHALRLEFLLFRKTLEAPVTLVQALLRARASCQLLERRAEELFRYLQLKYSVAILQKRVDQLSQRSATSQ